MLCRERNYRNLKVWEAAHALAIRVYAATRDFSDDERYGVVAQVRRSTVSIAANIAEGAAHSSNASFAKFVDIAYASAAETDYHLLLARDIGYLNPDVSLNGSPTVSPTTAALCASEPLPP